jgi:hypothetical protein
MAGLLVCNTMHVLDRTDKVPSLALTTGRLCLTVQAKSAICQHKQRLALVGVSKNGRSEHHTTYAFSEQIGPQVHMSVVCWVGSVTMTRLVGIAWVLQCATQPCKVQNY